MASKFFDYSRLSDTVNFDGGFPGDKGAVTPLDYVVAAVATEDLEFGCPVKLTYDKTSGVFKAELCKAAADFGGIVAKDVTGQRDRNDGYIYYIPKGQNVSVIRKGKVYVPIETGKASVAYGGTVYIKKTAKDGLPVGGLEATADSTNNEALTNIKFAGAVGNPVSGTNAATTASVKSSYTALVIVDLGIC